MQLLKALRLGPMTVDDIVEMYKYEGNEKALKTVYRYIKTLQEAGLIAEAGKRIVTDEENKNKSITIYCRTGKIFVDYTAIDMESKNEELVDRSLKIWTLVLQPMYPDKKANKEKVDEFLNKLYYESMEYYSQIHNSIEKELSELTKDYDFVQLNDLFRIMGFLYLVKTTDLRKEIDNCFE